MEAWSDFGVAVVGATAALIGLLFVALSINLRQILGSVTLPSRAAFALQLLTVPLVSTILLLVPQPPVAFGVELLVLSALLGPSLLVLARPGARAAEQPLLARVVATELPAAVAVLATVAAGVLLVTGRTAGLYGVAIATVAALAGALVSTWVLVVEILR